MSNQAIRNTLGRITVRGSDKLKGYGPYPQTEPIRTTANQYPQSSSSYPGNEQGGPGRLSCNTPPGECTCSYKKRSEQQDVTCEMRLGAGRAHGHMSGSSGKRDEYHGSVSPLDHTHYRDSYADRHVDHHRHDRHHDNGHYDERHYDDRRHDSRHYDDRPHDSRYYDDRPHDSRYYDDRPHGSRQYDDRLHDNHHHSNRHLDSERHHDERHHDDRHDFDHYDERHHDDRHHDTRHHDTRHHDTRHHDTHHQGDRHIGFDHYNKGHHDVDLYDDRHPSDRHLETGHDDERFHHDDLGYDAHGHHHKTHFGLRGESFYSRPASPHMFHKEALKAHNAKRALHGVAPLRLSSDLNEYAENYADELARKRIFQHSACILHGQRIGENLAYRWTSNHADYSVSDAVEGWYNEINDYDFSKELNSMTKTGHFTQLVWRETREFGIGKAHDDEGQYYIVASYRPPGNKIGEFCLNVLPPISSYMH